MKHVYLFAIFALFSGSVWSNDITIYCVSEDAATNVQLVEDGKSVVYKNVQFADGQYLLWSTDYDFLMSECRSMLVNGAFKSMLGVATRQFVGDKLSRYYPISSLESHIIGQGKLVFQSLKAEHVIDLYDDETKHLEKIESNLSKIKACNVGAYLDQVPIFKTDFARSDWKVGSSGEVLYQHSLQGMENNSPETKAAQIEVFEKIQRALEKFHENIEQQIGIKALRNRIALALATRTQTFDFNVVDTLQAFYKMKMPEVDFSLHGVGRTLNTVEVMPTKLHLETSGGVLISPILNGFPVPADLVRFHRSCEMDLETGKLSKETLVFEKT